MSRRVALRVVREVQVDAPPERVWECLVDHERMPEWAPVREVVRRRRGDPEPDGVGAVRVVRSLGLALEEAVVVFDPPGRLEYRLTAGAPLRAHRGAVVLEPQAGGTRVRWTIRFRPVLPGSGRPLAWVLARFLERTLAGLRRRVETGEPPRRRGKMRRSSRRVPRRAQAGSIMAEPTVVPDIASLKNLAGQRLGSSAWVEVSQEQIDAFAQATGDHQWIHVDVERARRESPFKQTIAHGYLTLALAPALLPQIIRVQGVRMGVNYGIDKMRLPAPVPAGARVRLVADLKEVREMPGGGARATYALTFEVEGGAKPACVADAIYVYYP